MIGVPGTGALTAGHSPVYETIASPQSWLCDTDNFSCGSLIFVTNRSAASACEFSGKRNGDASAIADPQMQVIVTIKKFPNVFIPLPIGILTGCSQLQGYRQVGVKVEYLSNGVRIPNAPRKVDTVTHRIKMHLEVSHVKTKEDKFLSRRVPSRSGPTGGRTGPNGDGSR